MVKWMFLALCGLVWQGEAFSQNQNCKEKYESSKAEGLVEDSLKHYFDYLECMLTEDPVLARQLITPFIARKEVRNNAELIRKARFLYANILVNQSEYEQALAEFNDLQALAEKEDDHFRFAYVQVNKGIIYRRMGQHGQSLEAYVLGLEAARKAQHLNMEATLLLNMGSLLNTMGKHDQAIARLKEALVLQEAMNNESGKAMVAANLGISLKNLGQTDSALVYYLQAAGSFERAHDFYNLAKMKSNIGQLYMAVERYNEAMPQLDAALEMMAAQNNFSDLINTLNAKADLLTRLKRWDEARSTARDAAKWAEEKQSTYGARNAYETIARASAALGDYKTAYEAQISSSVYNDSLNSEDQQELLAEMEAKYDAEKKDLLLQAKDSEIALQDTRIRLTNFTVGMLLLLAAVLAFNFIRIRKLNLRLSAQSDELEAKNEALASMGDFKDRLLTIVSHDVRNPLAGLKTVLAMQAAGEISPAEFDEWTRESAKRVDAALGMLGNLLEWSKTQLVGLKPYKETFNAEYFQQELHEQVQHQASLKKVKLRWEVEPGLSLHTDRHMLRTSMYNLISNAIKFSRKDDEVHIRMFRSKGGLTIEVRDQGVGMTPEVLARVRNPKDIYTTYGTENEKGTGIGLVLAYDMLELLGAGLSVDSKLGEGSTFAVFLPE